MSEDNTTAYPSATETGQTTPAIDDALVRELIASNAFDVHFQPIFSASQGTVYGYEALARPFLVPTTPFPSSAAATTPSYGDRQSAYVDVAQIFACAAQHGRLPELDLTCRRAALRHARDRHYAQTGAYLFLNICPETLTNPLHKVGTTDQLVDELGFDKARIILEITEEVAVKDYKLFSLAIAYYRDRGYKIAIDDFGAGYGGLKMLSVIHPDFIKIDRHFVSQLDRALVRYNLIDTIATACHRMGIEVVAEGIETEAELRALCDMGVDLLQGYYLARPEPDLYRGQITVPRTQTPSVEQWSIAPVAGKPLLAQRSGSSQDALSSNTSNPGPECCFIGDIARYTEPVTTATPLLEIFQRFIKEPCLRGLPVVEGESIRGLLHRNIFLEQELLGRHGYGFALNAHKSALELAKGHPFLCVEFNLTLEEVSHRIQAHDDELLYQDLCVSKNGKYLGTVAINQLLKAITERNLFLARGANPLTGLPGNLFIQSEVEKRMAQSMHFDVSYVDIDHFKPYNDCYGFEKGDHVLRTLGHLLHAFVKEIGNPQFDFVGHIGGDDFIVVSRPQHTVPIGRSVIAAFEARREEFHGVEDSRRGYYCAKNRQGEDAQLPLLSLSIGVVSSEVHRLESFAQLASLASEVKKAAKAQPNSSLVRDRRLGQCSS